VYGRLRSALKRGGHRPAPTWCGAAGCTGTTGPAAAPRLASIRWHGSCI